MARSIDLDGMGHGLTTEKQLYVNKLLQEYDPNLSLRRIPERDPAAIAGARLDPPKIFGVHEANVAPGQSPWAFTLAEMSIDERVLARVVSNDLQRRGASKQFADLLAIQGAAEAGRRKREAELLEEREDEMLTIGALARKKATFRHTLNGEDVIIGDRIRPARRSL